MKGGIGTLKLYHLDFRPPGFLGEGGGIPNLIEQEI